MVTGNSIVFSLDTVYDAQIPYPLDIFDSDIISLGLKHSILWAWAVKWGEVIESLQTPWRNVGFLPNQNKFIYGPQLSNWIQTNVFKNHLKMKIHSVEKNATNQQFV